ncbi:transposase [Rhodococcus aetherivorans]
MLAEVGDALGRYASAKARKNYAGTSPITRASGKTRVVSARHVHNDRLLDALHMQAACAILHDKQVRLYYDQLRARDVGHNAALRQVGNRFVGILHGCLKTHTPYDPSVGWHTVRSLPSLLDVKGPGMPDRIRRCALAECG